MVIAVEKLLCFVPLLTCTVGDLESELEDARNAEKKTAKENGSESNMTLIKIIDDFLATWHHTAMNMADEESASWSRTETATRGISRPERLTRIVRNVSGRSISTT